MSIFNYIIIASAAFLTLLVLVQTRGASLGAGLGGGGEVNTTRRGTDKTIFQITIVTGIVFAVSTVLSAIVK